MSKVENNIDLTSRLDEHNEDYYLSQAHNLRAEFVLECLGFIKNKVKALAVALKEKIVTAKYSTPHEPIV